MALVANIIGRNEADRYLHDVLEHLFRLTSNVVFTDDCSEDDTLSIAKEFGCHTYQTSKPMFTENEGILRQQSWSNLENHAREGDWVLAIDCDEKLWATSPHITLEQLLNQTRYDVIGIKFYHMWNENQYRIDKAWRPNMSSRMFRYRANGQFKQSKLACGSEPTYVQGMIRSQKALWDSGLVMQHLGYMDDADKSAKYARYSTIDKGDFHAISHIESIMDQNPMLVDWEISRQESNG